MVDAQQQPVRELEDKASFFLDSIKEICLKVVCTLQFQPLF
jgi:hypothetical protein